MAPKDKLVAPKDFYLDQNTIPLMLFSHLRYSSIFVVPSQNAFSQNVLTPLVLVQTKKVDSLKNLHNKTRRMIYGLPK